MSTLDKSLEAPIGIVAYKGSNVEVDPFVYGADGTTFKIAWHSKYRTYQIRYRRRLRVKPTDTKAGGWKGWEAWQGAAYCSKSTSRGTITRPSNTQDWDTWNMANGRPSSSTNLYSANLARYVHYPNISPVAYGTYDGEQWQVQVRAYDEGSKKHGNTLTYTIDVVHNPTFSVSKVVLDSDNGILVYYTTNWNRDGNAVQVSNTKGRLLAEIGNVKGGLNGTYFKIPANSLDKNYDVGTAFKLPLEYMTGDPGRPNAVLTPNLSVQSKYPVHDVEPTMTLTPDQANHKVTVTLTEAGRTYPWISVTVRAVWTGPDGAVHSVAPSNVVSEDLTGRSGVYEFTNVPSDVTVSYRAQVASADSDADPEALKQSYKLNSKGKAFLTIGDECAFLYLGSGTPGLTWQRAYEPNVETEVCAGRQREVSRHGIGGTASIQVRGVIIKDSTHYDMGAGARLADWEAMKRRTGADGTISLPGNIWAKVCITSIEIDTESPLHTVTVSMQEVV